LNESIFSPLSNGGVASNQMLPPLPIIENGKGIISQFHGQSVTPIGSSGWCGTHNFKEETKSASSSSNPNKT